MEESSHAPPIVALPPAYSPTAEASTKRYLIDLAEFLSSPFARALVDSHPNRAVGGVADSGEALEEVWRWSGQFGSDDETIEDQVCLRTAREDLLGKLCAGKIGQDVSQDPFSQSPPYY